MGFFQDLKQDLSQTVNDLENENTPDNISLLDDNADKDEYGSLDIDVAAMLENLDSTDSLNETDAAKESDTTDEAFIAGLESEQEPTLEDATEQETVQEATLEEATSADDTKAETNAEEPATNESVNEESGEIEMEELLKEVELNVEEPETIEEPKVEVPDNAGENAISSDTAIITEGMTITGDITSSGNMDLIGTVTGNIDILGKLNITGNVTGNSSAAEIYAESAQINGEVRSKGSVKIGQSSVIIGDIFATSAVIAGAVKGDIDVHGPVILDTSAIVMGNIKSKSVQINNGAVIEGMCSQCYADVSPSTFFNDVKKNRSKR
jgi:cytoskeletal protein CcmA (bactofilin family)